MKLVTSRPPYTPAAPPNQSSSGQPPGGAIPRSGLHIPMPPGTMPPRARQQSPPAKPTGSVAWVSVNGADVFASVGYAASLLAGLIITFTAGVYGALLLLHAIGLVRWAGLP